MTFLSKFKKQKDSSASDRPVPPPNLQPQLSSTLSTISPRSLSPSSTASQTTNYAYLPVNNYSKSLLNQIASQPVEAPANSVAKPTLIVGIDFGTTNSGVAYSWATGADAKEAVLSEWAGLGNMSLFKIPTAIYYDSSGEVVGWGANTENALSPAGVPIPGVTKIEYFKLLLQGQYNNRYGDLTRDLRLPPGKTAVDVAADYLSLIRMAMRMELQKALGSIFIREEQNVKYFLTVPAIWDDAAKSATRQAAVQAGFIDSINDARLSLITEPEAAAIFCAKRGVLELKPNQSFLIVDCGGGTVDLIAYEVEDENPFTVRECTSGTGAACGSTTIDANFMKLVNARIKLLNDLGLLTVAKEEKIMRRCREDFAKIKQGFKNAHGQEIAIEIGLDINCPQAQIVEGYMMFQAAHIQAAFEPSVKAVVSLVRDQIAAVEAQHKQLQAILVVGGYGASTYLFDTLKNQVPPAYSTRILRPMDSVSAIVRGAVVTGIYERVLTSRVCRKHYMMMTLQKFQPGVHPEEYRIKAPDGGYRCKNTRKIFLEKGQRLMIGEQAKVEFFRQVLVNSPRIFEDTLYTCVEDRCPEFITDPAIKVFAVLTTDLSQIPISEFELCTGMNGDSFYRIHFDVVLTLDGGNEMRAEWRFKDKVMGHVRTKFS
ncbi:hypothetical protein V1525DRAFT_383293 [Lipomyces kononenkoae]|uniref:Uncharacterized protein n=1 Tax=Lipomyces kononenkoae TaxID=34357 RepID=A0ACC3SS91_LIPKO